MTGDLTGVVKKRRSLLKVIAVIVGCVFLDCCSSVVLKRAIDSVQTFSCPHSHLSNHRRIKKHCKNNIADTLLFLLPSQV